MRTYLCQLGVLAVLLAAVDSDAYGWGRGGFGGFHAGGFGGFRGGGFSGFHAGGFGGFREGGFGGYRSGGFGGFREGGFGGYRSGGWGGSRDSSFGGYRAGGFGDFDRGSYAGYRSGGAAWGDRGFAAGGSYDRSWTGAPGGSISAEGRRGVAVGPGGAVAGRSREVTATGPGGRTYTGASRAGAAVGPGGNVVAGGSRAGVASGPRGTIAGSSRAGIAAGAGGVVAGGSRAGVAVGRDGAVAGVSHWGAGATRFPTDLGLARYSSFAVGGIAHPTYFWSHSYLTGWAGNVRASFLHYNCFTPAWCTSHPLAWTAAGWALGTAWSAATWPAVASFVSISSPPVYYDYGSTIVYQGSNVYDNGDDVGTATQYAQQASTLAEQGQQAKPPTDDKWESLGVFALAQGEEKTSNNLFQLALNKAGIIRGNYYDALMDTTSAVYGAVDKKTQRAAWTIGDKKEPVFETGFYNLTKDETPVLVHFGKDRTQQWLLVRVEQPSDQK
jgi:hypothetical protein